jgi:hypothetical protein
VPSLVWLFAIEGVLTVLQHTPFAVTDEYPLMVPPLVAVVPVMPVTLDVVTPPGAGEAVASEAATRRILAAQTSAGESTALFLIRVIPVSLLAEGLGCE